MSVLFRMRAERVRDACGTCSGRMRNTLHRYMAPFFIGYELNALSHYSRKRYYLQKLGCKYLAIYLGCLSCILAHNQLVMFSRSIGSKFKQIIELSFGSY